MAVPEQSYDDLLVAISHRGEDDDTRFIIRPLLNEVERLRAAAKDIDAALTIWREHQMPPATDLRKLTEHIREIDLALAAAHDRFRSVLNG